MTVSNPAFDHVTSVVLTRKPTSVFRAAVRRGRLAVDGRRRQWRRWREVAVGRAACRAAEVHHGQRARQLVVHEGGGEQVELALRGGKGSHI